MNRVMLFLATIGASMASWSRAEERGLWYPGPAALGVGAIADGQVLCYQWQPSNRPEPPNRVRLAFTHFYVPSEKWYAAEQWEPKDIRWFLVDLRQREVKALAEVLPEKAELLGKFPARIMIPHHAPHRWRLGSGWFWGTAIIGYGGANPFIPSVLIAMPFDPPQDRTAQPKELAPSSAPVFLAEGAREIATKAGDAFSVRAPDPDRSDFATSISQLSMLSSIHTRALNSPARKALIDFDFLPRSKREVLLFVLCNKEIGVWRYQLESKEDKGGRLYLEGGWQQQTTFASPFLEPFHVAAAKDEYFFVTDESGEVYAAQNRDGQWTTRTVWKDASRPVVAMLVESDGMTAFVFGKDFYLKLGRDDKPKPCRDVTQGPAEFGQPLRTVYECGRVLFDSGELKDAKPKQ